MLRLGLLAHLAEADDLAAEPAEPADQHVADGQDPLADADLAAIDDDRGLVDRLEPRGHRPELRLDVAAGEQDRVAHEHGRPARRRLLVVRDDGGVAHDDRDPVDRGAELLRRRSGRRSSGRPGPCRTCRRRRSRSRRRAGGRSSTRGRSSAPTSARPRCRDRDRAPADSPTRSARRRARTVSRPVPVRRGVAGDEAHRPAGRGCGAAARAGSMPEDLRGLVHVRFDRPDLLGIAEAAERGRWRRVREDAPGDDPDRRDRGTAPPRCSCPCRPSGRRCRRRRR